MRANILFVALAAAMIAGPVRADDKPQADRQGAPVVGPKDTQMTVTVTAGEAREAQPKEPAAPDGRGGWIGVRVSPVPAALDKHLSLGGKGVMIGNLVRGSPADKAGLVRYDVIVATDGDKPVEDVGQFIALIQQHRPGQKIQLTVLRKARKEQVSVVLGEMPPGPEDWQFVHEEEPDEQWEDQLKLHRGVLRKGPEGWVFDGIKDLKGQIELELPRIMAAMPKGGWGDVQIQVGATGGAKKAFRISRSVDGRKIDIESGKEGQIIVRRVQDGKGEVTRTYKSAEELKEQDSEAYELYKSAGVSAQGAGLGMRLHHPWPPAGRTKEAAEAMKKAQEQLQEQMRTWTDKARQTGRAARERIALPPQAEPVQREFDVDDAGRIKVRVREGGTEARLTFKDEEEMKTKAPNLHEAYQKLLRGGQPQP